MTQRGMAVVAMAAGVLFGGANLASAQDASERIQQQSEQAQQRLQKAGQDASEHAEHAGQAIQAGASQQQGQQIDQQVLKQLQQIQQSPEQAGDKLFVLCAAINNNFEMMLSQQAAQKAQNPEVKKLAQMIMQDHQQAGQQLQQVAQQMQLQVPQGLPSIKQQEIQVMTSLPSQQFDKVYVAKMNELHAMDVTAFGSQTTLAQNPQLKQFVTQALPKLQQHQQHVMRTAQQIGLTGGGSGDAQQAGSRESGSSTSGSSSGTSSESPSQQKSGGDQ